MDNMSITYDEMVNIVLSTPKFVPGSGPDNTREILEKLGNPQDKFKSVHIAGTNGKGSVAKMMSIFLDGAGYKTGLFISPHLVKINERMSIGGVDISDDEMVHIFSIIKDIVLPMHPAQFDLLFIMAAMYFAEKECEYVVLETGLGGRLDATNIVTPEISIITSIGLDHMQYLGSTIEEIAWEKAGIIKPYIPVIFNTGSEVADGVIEKQAQNTFTPFVNVREDMEELQKLMTDEVLEKIDSFTALYQRDNAYTVAEATLMMGFCKGSDTKKDFQYNELLFKTFDSFFFPGRMEFLKENVIIDGAHNEDAILRLVESVKTLCYKTDRKKISILFAVSSDKDYEAIIRILSKSFSSGGLSIEDVYVSELDSERRKDAGELVGLFQKYLPVEKHFEVVGTTNLESAWKLATGELADDTLLVAVGSLYMVGEIKKIISKTGDAFQS